MSSFLRLSIIFILSTTTLFAQNRPENGSIRGSITTSDGKPAFNVTLYLQQTNKGAYSNEKGEYLIRNVKPGTYTLKVTSVVTSVQEKSITVTAGQTATADFVLGENAAQLKEVTVSANHIDRQTPSVAKIPLTNLENPQVYNSVSSELMKQQGITNFDDAMRNVPGISRTWESTGRAGDGGAYFALRGFDAQPSLTNGLPGLVSGNLDPANIEEIQVMKGPSAAMFGGRFYSYGGLINTITKKPFYGFGGEVAYNFGSFGLNRITADVNARLSQTEKIAMRINTAYHSENSFQDAGFKKSFFFAPSLSYEVNDRLSFQLMAEILQEERAVAPVFFHSDRATPLTFKNLGELGLDRKQSFTNNDLTIRNPRYSLQAQMIYKLSGQWTSQTVLSRGSIKSDGIYTYIWDDKGGVDYFSQYFHNENQTTNTTDIQQNFNGDFKIGGVRNRLLIGLDVYNTSIIDNGNGWMVGRYVKANGDVLTEDPETGDEIIPVPLSKSGVDNLMASSAVNNAKTSTTSYSAYASDVVNITPGLMAMVSLRADYYDTKGNASTPDEDFDQFTLSPKFGLVYQPVLDKVSIFASYMNAFVNIAPQALVDQDYEPTGEFRFFDPEHANQWEGGVKLNLFSDRLFATVSAYDMKVDNKVVPEIGTNNSRQMGKVQSRGVELDLNANPAPGLNIIAGYSFNETKVLEGTPGDFYSEPGRAPGGQGPQNLANLWANYKFNSGKLKNFGIGAGGNYASEYLVIDNSATGQFNLPAYTLINAGLFYNSSKVRVSFNMNNIGNKEYYIGYWSVNPQKGRNYTVSMGYKF